MTDGTRPEGPRNVALDPAQVARLLRQRTELAVPPLILDGVGRDAFMRAVAALGAQAAPAEAKALRRRPEAAPGVGERMAAKAAAARAAAEVSEVQGGEEGAEDALADRMTAALDASSMDYDTVRETAMACTRCGLAETRTNVVFSDGNPDARLVVVGEAPGANEDKTGVPFVGAAGKLLDLMLASVDLSREDSVYICNVLKCRPPGNRNPTTEEIQACAPFLKRQLELVKPDALLAVGTFAGQLLTSRDKPLGRLRGEVHSYEGIPLVVTYHPAALLRNSGWVRPTWDDLQLLRQVMDG